MDADGLVAGEAAGGDGQGKEIGDAATNRKRISSAAADGLVAGEAAGGDGQGAVVADAAATAGALRTDAAADSLVVDKSTVADRESAVVVDAAALSLRQGEPEEGKNAHSLIVGENAVGDGGRRTELIPDAAAHDAKSLIAGESRAVEAGAALVQDTAPARNGTVAGGNGVGDGHIAGEGHGAEVQGGTAFVQDATPAALDVPLDKAIRDRQAGDGHSRPASEVKDPAGGIAANGQFLRAQPLDVQVLGDRQLAVRQGDRVACELLGELDRVAGTGAGDHGAQRPTGAIVERARDRQRAEYGAIFEGLQPRHKARPCGALCTARVPP